MQVSSSSVMVEAECLSEMLVPVYQATLRAVPEGCDIHIYHCRHSDDTLTKIYLIVFDNSQ